MLGPLGLLSPHPGVSYLFSGADAAPVGDGDGLWGIAHGGIGPGPGVAAAAAPGAGGAGAGGVPGASGFHGGFGGQSNGGGVGMGGGGPLASPPPSWTPALGEMVLKVDTKFKVRRAVFPLPVFPFARPEKIELIFGDVLENHLDAIEGLGCICKERDQRRARIAGSAAEECGGGGREQGDV